MSIESNTEKLSLYFVCLFKFFFFMFLILHFDYA